MKHDENFKKIPEKLRNSEKKNWRKVGKVFCKFYISGEFVENLRNYKIHFENVWK